MMTVRSRRLPLARHARVANRMLRRVRDYAQVEGGRHRLKAVAEAALKMLDVDVLGLDVMDRKLLLAVIEKFSGGPVDLDNLAHAYREDAPITIEDVLGQLDRRRLQRRLRGRCQVHTASARFGDAPRRRRRRAI